MKILKNPWVIGGLVLTAILVTWYIIRGKKVPYSEWALMRYVTTESSSSGANHLPAGHRLFDSTGFRVGKDEPAFKAGDSITVTPAGLTAITGTVLDVFKEPRAGKPQEYWVATSIRTSQVEGTKTGTIAKK